MIALQVRPITDADVLAVAEIHSSCWRRHYAHILPAEFLASITQERCAHQWWTRIADQSRDTFESVVTDGGRPAGFAIGQPASANTDSSHELRSFYTDKNRQSPGAAWALMRHMLSTLHDHAPKPVHLWVMEANLHARKFFATMGFRPDGGHRDATFGDATVTLLRYQRSVSLWENRRPSAEGGR